MNNVKIAETIQDLTVSDKVKVTTERGPVVIGTVERTRHEMSEDRNFATVNDLDGVEYELTVNWRDYETRETPYSSIIEEPPTEPSFDIESITVV